MLEEFFGSQQELAAVETHPGCHEELRQFFTSISDPIAQTAEQQRKLEEEESTRFNVFDLIQPDENTLSDILRDLLDTNGSHGQGDLFLGRLFKKLGYGSFLQNPRKAKVYREAPTNTIPNRRRRIDLLVEADVLIGIENKKDSPEQENQVRDYLTHLANCSSGGKRPNVLIYLTPDRRLPASLTAAEIKAAQAEGRLRCWSYQRELRDWLEECSGHCKAKKMQYFIGDFITYIGTVLKRDMQPDVQEEPHEP